MSLIMRSLLIWLLVVEPVSGGLARYRDLVVADRPPARSSLGKVRLTYLGTNGYRFENGRHALLVDPYFSRIGLGAFVFRTPVAPNLATIESAADFLAETELILATHAHIDHLFDVPAIMQRTRARLLASATAVSLVSAAGVTAERCLAVVPGDVRQVGPWRIRVLPATHERVFPIGWTFSGSAPNDRSAAAGERLGLRPAAGVCDRGGRQTHLSGLRWLGRTSSA